jgi:PST family polysaccharide transporter
MAGINSYFRDFFKIGVVQGLNYLVPFAIIPVLVRIIGKEYWGVISYSQAFIAYFLLVINYSFDLTATRELAVVSGQKEKVDLLFNQVLQAKILLFLVTVLVFAVTLSLSSELWAYKEVHILFFLSNIGFVFYQPWFFQGERIYNKAVIINLLAKLVWGIGVFLFIRKKEDFILYAGIYFLSQLLLGVIGLFYLLHRYKIRLYLVSVKQITDKLKEGKSVFFSNLFVNLSTTTNIFILGFFASMNEVGNYAAGNKIIAIITSVVITSFTINGYPILVKKLTNKEHSGETLFQLNTFIALVFGLLLSIAMFFTAEWVLLLVFGNEFADAITTYRIMSLLPLLIFINNILVVHGLLNFKLDKEFFKLTAFSASFSIALNVLLSNLYKDVGSAYAWVLTELFILVYAYLRLSSRIKVFNLSVYKQLNRII